MICSEKMHPVDVHLRHFDNHRLSPVQEQGLNLTSPRISGIISWPYVIVSNISCPLHPETEHMFNDDLISKCKQGAYIINTARGKICDKDAIARALESGQLSGYAGDVWFLQPAPNDHVRRTMRNSCVRRHTLRAHHYRHRQDMLMELGKY